MGNNLIYICLLAAVLSLDITAFGQFMVSRPIVCATLFGYILGDIKTGLWVGMTVELIWIGAIPMGAAIPIETTAVAILSVLWGLTIQPFDRAGVILALALSVFAGILFRRADILIRYSNVKIMRWVERGVVNGKESRVDVGIYSGIAMFFLKAFILYLAVYYPGRLAVEFIYTHLTPKILTGLRVAWTVLPVLGMGFLLVNFRDGKFPFNKIEEIGRQKGFGK